MPSHGRCRGIALIPGVPVPCPPVLAATPHAPSARRPLQGLARRGKLASLTVAQLTKYLQLHKLPTSGKKADIIARITEHVIQQAGPRSEPA